MRVLELAAVLAGPSVGCFLAEMGADVIKVEPPAGDVTRQWLLPGEQGTSAYFSAINWGKRSVCLDLTQPEDLKVALALAGQADIVIANYKPGSAARLGMDYASLSRQNPRLIYGSITGYGEHNPRAGFDAIVQAESGLMYLTREPGQEPLKTPVAIMDLLAAHQLKEAVLLALYHRERTGQGVQVATSLIEAGVTALANLMSAWLWRGQDPEPLGADHPSIAPYGTLFRAADGHHLLLAVGTDAQFVRLCEVLQLPALAADTRFVTNAARVRHRDVLKPLLQEAVARYERDTLMDLLAAQKIPAGRILRVSQAAALPEVQHLLLTHPAAQGLGLRTAAFNSSGWQPAEMTPPPALGQHTEEIRVQLHTQGLL
ncbi:MAG: CoA transferase [Bacteroidetes bacterium]|nr:CoA transferase [Bacteroidota bacterium]